MKLNAVALDNIRRFLNLQMKSILNRLRLVYHEGFGEVSKQRNQIGKGKPQAIEIAQGIEGIRQTWYGETGVGVYQGEAVILAKCALVNPPQWVICTLRPSLVHLIRKDVVCELLQAAVILADYLQSASAKNHSQNSDEIRLFHNCPHTKQHKNSGLALPEVFENAECPLPNLLAKELVPLLYQCSAKCPKCPFERIIDLLNGGLNQSGKEPSEL